MYEIEQGFPMGKTEMRQVCKRIRGLWLWMRI